MIPVWLWFASPQKKTLQNDADLRTATLGYSKVAANATTAAEGYRQPNFVSNPEGFRRRYQALALVSAVRSERSA
jgi:hypothetical protein